MTDQVKVGDKLFLKEFGIFEMSLVKRITPSGRIFLENGCELNPDLTIRGGGYYSRCYSAQLFSEKLDQAYKRQQQLRSISSFNFHSLSNGQIDIIFQMIKEKNENSTQMG